MPVIEDPQPGDVLGSYRVEDVLGVGAMGCVYRAIGPDGTPVALKVVKAQLADDERYRQRFLMEAEAATRITHPHLVSILDAGEIGGRQYLAMDLVTGRPLEQRIQQDGPLSVVETTAIIAQIGAALDALHAAGVMHRDVKVSNILLRENGTAALTDFGLAKGTGSLSLTMPGQIVGTLGYLAPERIRGEKAIAASDIYALGCVAFECLTGDHPFAGSGPMGVAFGHLEKDAPDPSQQRADVPPAFGAAVLTALVKDPAGRPSSGAAYGELLRVALAQ